MSPFGAIQKGTKIGMTFVSLGCPPKCNNTYSLGTPSVSSMNLSLCRLHHVQIVKNGMSIYLIQKELLSTTNVLVESIDQRVAKKEAAQFQGVPKAGFDDC